MNYTHKVDGDTLTITVKLSAPSVPSASGKSLVIASSRGNVEVQKGVFLGLNVYKKLS